MVEMIPDFGWCWLPMGVGIGPKLTEIGPVFDFFRFRWGSGAIPEGRREDAELLGKRSSMNF